MFRIHSPPHIARLELTCGILSNKALNSSDLSSPVRKETIGLLYKTCEHHAIVPSRLTVRADYDQTSDALYKGGYADVWKSQHSGRDVAVKAIRLYSKHVSRKVINVGYKWCSISARTILTLLNRNSAS